MPYLKIQTNVDLPAAETENLLKAASKAVAEALGKPERYVMVAVEGGRPIVFSGQSAPAAFLELKSIGLPENRTSDLSSALCALMKSALDVPEDRVYIEFANAKGGLWGWNGGTF